MRAFGFVVSRWCRMLYEYLINQRFYTLAQQRVKFGAGESFRFLSLELGTTEICIRLAAVKNEIYRPEWAGVSVSYFSKLF